MEANVSTDQNPFVPGNNKFRRCLKGHVDYSASFDECPSCKIERNRSSNLVSRLREAREFLHKNSTTYVDGPKERSLYGEAADELERLQQCRREGWLYADEMKEEFERRGREIERLRTENDDIWSKAIAMFGAISGEMRAGDLQAVRDEYLRFRRASETSKNPRRELSASERLHNICDALSEHADESPFTREEWEEVDRQTVKLTNALSGLYWDTVDYLTLNNLGGMDNHWMRAAREALGIGPNAPRPAVKTECGCPETYPQLVAGRVSHGPGCAMKTIPVTACVKEESGGLCEHCCLPGECLAANCKHNLEPPEIMAGQKQEKPQECDCPAKTCQPENNEGRRCWWSGAEIPVGYFAENGKGDAP